MLKRFSDDSSLIYIILIELDTLHKLVNINRKILTKEKKS